MGVSISGVRNPGCPTGVTLAQGLAHNRSSSNICGMDEGMVLTRAFAFKFSMLRDRAPGHKGEGVSQILRQFWVLVSLV